MVPSTASYVMMTSLPRPAVVRKKPGRSRLAQRTNFQKKTSFVRSGMALLRQVHGGGYPKIQASIRTPKQAKTCVFSVIWPCFTQVCYSAVGRHSGSFDLGARLPKILY